MANPVKIIQTLLKAETEIGEYIISPGGNLFERWYKDRFKDRCNEFGNLPAWARALSGVSGGSISRICQPHFDQIGADGPVLPPPPFLGGQCPGVLYQVTASGPNNSDVIIQQTSDSIPGPIIRIVGSDTGVGDAQSLFIIHGNNQASALGITVSAPRAAQWTILVVDRVDGQPDGCGDPPNAPLIPGPNPPPNPGPLPGPEPRDDPDGGPIPEIPIPPYQDPTFGPQPYEPGDEPGGGGEPEPPRSPAGGDGLPGAPDAVDGPVGTTGNNGEGEDFNFGPPPEGRVWVGVLVENTVDSRLGNIPGTGPQNTVYPYVVGNASLIYAGGYSSSSRMRSRWHEMFRPVTALQVTGARVQCRPGVTASVRPVSAMICPDNTCEDNNNG